MNTIGDFHIHSPYCPHGTNDAMEVYVKTAIEKGLKYLTFTEHAPLPVGFEDPTPDKDSSMRIEDIDDYLTEADRLKRKYKANIDINVGFEIDFIEGFENEIRQFITKYKRYMEDSILSVHMLKTPTNEYVCIDFSADEFERIISLFGSVEAVYDCYYQTIKQSIVSDLGDFKPKRIGHPTLIEKFSKKYPVRKDYSKEIKYLLNIIKHRKLELDANTAGFYKQDCLECYPNKSTMVLAKELNIPLVFGSDSHTALHIGRGDERLNDIPLSLPRHLD